VLVGTGKYSASMALLVPRLIGDNAREIRVSAGATQRDVAAALTGLGLPWTSNRVAKMESGDFAPTLQTLVFIAAALDALASGSVTLSDLVSAPEGVDVILTTRTVVPARYLSEVLRGRPAGALSEHRPCPPPASREPHKRNYGEYTPADRRVAGELGLSRPEMLRLARGLWGRSLSAERDRRIGDREVSRVEKSRTTALLREEMREALGGEKTGEKTGKNALTKKAP
jgi:transcriptional regulator with XRE-family HTH domain